MKPTIPERSQLTTSEKAQIRTYKAGGWSDWRIAKALKRSPHTVRKYLDVPDVQAEVLDEKTELAQLYRDKARACVVAIDADKINKSSALQLATAGAICTDKALLLTGEAPPLVNVTLLLSVAEIIRTRLRDGETAPLALPEAKGIG